MQTPAIRFDKTGGPEEMKLREVGLPAPQAGEVLLKHEAIGVNYIDTYHLGGLYPVPLPSGLGMEGAGIVEAVGAGVHGLSPGDRVAYGTGPLGAYAQRRVMPAQFLLKLPEAIPFETAAGMMLQGMTVEYLIHRTYPVKAGDTVLLHAAAGGVGSLAAQWLSHLGATVIGTASTEGKRAKAKAHGCAHVLDYRDKGWVKELRDLTSGRGVDVVYDGVGGAMFLPSLDCLRPRGMMVTFGNAAGPAPEISPLLLTQKGSLFLTRPSLAAYTATREDLELSAGRLFEVVSSSAVHVDVGQTYPLAQAAQAHRDLKGRKTSGSIVLTP